MDVCTSLSSNSLTESFNSRKNIRMACSTSTPKRKPTLRVFLEKRNVTQHTSSVLTSPNGPPPSLPTTPKPQAAITKLELEELEPISPQENLEFSSLFEDNTGKDDNWSPRSYPIGNNELQIKRRYSDIPRQRIPLSLNWNMSALDSTTAVNSTTSSKYSRFTSASSLRHTESTRLGFVRNSPARIAKHRRSRKSVQTLSSGKNGPANTDITSLRKYQKDNLLSSFKPNEIPLRSVE